MQGRLGCVLGLLVSSLALARQQAPQQWGPPPQAAPPPQYVPAPAPAQVAPAQYAPAPAGAWVEDPVSFVDLPATVFSLCRVPIPAHFEGRPFLGEKTAPPRDHVFLYRGRMDERYDTVRAVRDREFQYVRN